MEIVIAQDSDDHCMKNFILTSSRVTTSKSLLKDSSSSFYSVYRNEGFDPNKWKNTLEPDQISGIEKHTMDIFAKLLEFSSN